MTNVYAVIRDLANGLHRLGGLAENVHHEIVGFAYANDPDVRRAEEEAKKAPLSHAEATELQRLLARYNTAADAQQDPAAAAAAAAPIVAAPAAPGYPPPGYPPPGFAWDPAAGWVPAPGPQPGAVNYFAEQQQAPGGVVQTAQQPAGAGLPPEDPNYAPPPGQPNPRIEDGPMQP